MKVIFFLEAATNFVINSTLRNWPIEKCMGLIRRYIEIARLE